MKRIRYALALSALVGACFSAGCASTTGGVPSSVPPDPRPSGGEPTIRVLVLATSGSATVATTSGYRIIAAGGVVLTSDRGGTITVRRGGRTLAVRVDATGQAADAQDEVIIEPSNASVSVGGVWYAGRIRVRANQTGGLDLINLVPVEAYLAGVVPHEIGEPGPESHAAVQAQAIAARTYALSRMLLNRDQPFDVEAGVQDQVYRGRERESRLAASAIRDTRGVVLMNGDALCDAYYSATCGGHTSDIRIVWPDRPEAPYLHGRRDAGADGVSFCAGARNFRWRHTFSGRTLGAIVRQTIPAALGAGAERVGDLVDVRVLERDRSGRVRRLEIVTSTETFVAESDRIRRVIMLDVQRGRILPSTLFDVETVMTGGRAGRVSFVGGGNGHGVGMCQNGAIEMAKRGYSYTMILQHYYPGTAQRARY